MSDAEKQLLLLLKDRSFRAGQPGQYHLASGGTSRYYVDGKMCEVYSRSALLIGEVLYQRTKDLNIDAIGGLEVGAVPLTTAAVISYQLKGRDMEGFWVRDKAKGHGTRKLIEGRLEQGMRVAIVDDVITKGGSALKAVEEVQRAGCDVAIVIALVDRLCGAEALFKEKGVTNYVPIFTIRDLGGDADVSNTVHAATG
jgi:orotate phosphoribosyltransferase